MKGDPLGIVQEIEIRTYYQMVYALNRIHPVEKDAKNFFWDFEIEIDQIIPAR